MIERFMLKHPFWFGVLATLMWLVFVVSVSVLVAVSPIAQQRKPAPVARPETIDTNGLLQRIEAKVDRLTEKIADHEEHTEKLCGPK